MLKKLIIDGLRGSTKEFELPFDPNKRISIIYGENGRGKSTVCDALEFVLDGNVSSLDKRGLHQTTKYWPSTGRPKGAVKVLLETKHGQWQARFGSGRGVVITPDNGAPGIAVLRRRQILELVCANPSDRFKVISPFIDITEIEASEKELGDLIRAERRSSETALARVEENRVAINGFWKEAGSPGKDALTWAKAEAAKDISDLTEELELLTKVDQTINAIDSSGDRWVELTQKSKELVELEKIAAKELKKAKDAAKGGEAEAVEILQAAAGIMHGHEDPVACPLCESSENVKGLVKRIDDRLAQIEGVTKAMEVHRKAKQAAERNTAGEVEECTRLKKALLKFCQAFVARKQWPKDVQPAKALLVRAGTIAAASDANAIPDEGLIDLVNSIMEFGDAITAAIETRQGRKAVFTQLKQAVKVYDENLEAQKHLEVLIPRYEAVLAAIADERKAFVDSILAGIATRVGVLYEKVHPGEGLSKIELQLDPNKRASLEIGATFPGVIDAPPQAYFSDSHLDTLGLCIFIAIAEIEAPGNKVVVMDDVLGSVDEPHVERVVNMLYDVAGGFQHLVLTTHYKPWREMFRWGHLRSGECEFIELLDWSHAHGITHGRSIPQVDQLRDALAVKDPDPQVICAKAGVILEAVLDFITLQYRCKVPRQDGGYTLGDLLNAMNSKLKASLKVEVGKELADGTTDNSIVELGPILEELLKLAGSRNVIGCHFNELAAHFPDAVAVKFSTLVLQLADAIIDPVYGWPKLDSSGSYWSNKKETRKLHPLKQPV